MNISEFTFWLSLGLIFYIYFGYPIIIFLISKCIKLVSNKETYTPNVTIVISAYNEEEFIKKTIENKLNLNYPKDKLRLVIISDGSDDQTDEIVKSIKDERITFYRQEARNGKTVALNKAITLSTGDIIVFSDANSIYEKDAVRNLVNNFSNEDVGYVTGKMIYQNIDGTIVGDGCSTYMKYENIIRKYESSFNSIVGVDGGIDAVRKELYEEMKNDQLPDFVLPLTVISKGYRVIYDEKAILQEETTVNQQKEYSMRVRVGLRAMRALFDMRHLVNPLKYPVYCWQLISHKILRYLAFIPLLLLLVANMFLIYENSIYMGFFVLQILFYLLGIIGYCKRNNKNIPPIFYIPYYFILLNAACIHAFIKFISGHKQIIWTPRTG